MKNFSELSEKLHDLSLKNPNKMQLNKVSRTLSPCIIFFDALCPLACTTRFIPLHTGHAVPYRISQLKSTQPKRKRYNFLTFYYSDLCVSQGVKICPFVCKTPCLHLTKL